MTTCNECKPLNGNFPKFKEFRQSIEKKYLEDLIRGVKAM